MTDYRSFFDRKYLGAWDLLGRDIDVQIARVAGEELVVEGNKKKKAPVIYFVGKDKGLVLNKTMGKTIAAMFGTNTKDWRDRWITIFPTTTSVGGETKECIRVRPNPPRRAQKRDEPDHATPQDEPLEPGSLG